MTKLVFFVTTTTCYAALETEHGIIQDFYILGTESQSAALVPFIKNLWDRANNPSLTQLVAPKGPGSFTGLRVTLATAQGLSIAFPSAICYAPTFFDVLLYNKSEQTYAVIDSKRGDYFVKTKINEAQILTPDAFLKFQKEHSNWDMIVEPDLINNNFVNHPKSIHYKPEELLNSLLAADMYVQPDTFNPYYLFDPTFKKSEKALF